MKKVTHENCEQWLTAISDYIDGELPNIIREELETHLTECGDCQLLVNTTKKSISLAQQLTSQKISEEIKSRLLSVIDEVKKKSNFNSGSMVAKELLAICPQCGERAVDVDGMLNQYCIKCDFQECGAFT